jgi:ankyrin repeat protein
MIHIPRRICQIVEYLIRAGADVNSASSNSMTALYYAACNSNLDLVRFLYSFNADMEVVSADGLTPFIVACLRDALPIMEFIHKHCPSCISDGFHLTDDRNRALLHVVMVRNSPASFYLLRHIPLSSFVRHGDIFSKVILHCLCTGHVGIPDSMIRRVLSFNTAGCRETAYALLMTTTQEGETAFLQCIRVEQLTSVEWFINALGVYFKKSLDDIRRFVNSGTRDLFDSPLAWAVARRNHEIVRLLVRYGANVDGVVLGEPLMLSVSFGRLEYVKILLQAGARRGADSSIWVSRARIGGHFDITKYLRDTEKFSSRLNHMLDMPQDAVYDLLRSGVDIYCNNEEEMSWLYHNEGTSSIYESPLETAERIANERRSRGQQVPIAVEYVLSAGRAWSPENHALFDHKARLHAIEILKWLGYSNVSRLPIDVWIQYIIPFAVSRMFPPLTRSEANKIRLDTI